MRIGTREQRQALAATGIGLGSVVWAVAQAARGDWEFYLLAVVLTIVTNLTVVDITERRRRSSEPRP